MRISDWSSDVCSSDLLRSKKLIVVKSAHHFHAAFAPVASEVLYVDAPGTCQQNFAGFPFTKRSLHYWPRVADPWQDRRSEERSVGEECVSTGRSRCEPVQ